MGHQTNIAWTDSTMNFWRGCTRVSPGCDHCYAEALDARFGGGHWGKGAPRIKSKSFDDPLKWNEKPWVCDGCGAIFPKAHSQKCACSLNLPTFHRRRVFSLSLGDWLDPEVPVEWLAEMLDVIRRCPNLDFLLLTKRPELYWERVPRALRMARQVADARTVMEEIDRTPESIQPLLSYPGYFISNGGVVYGTGSTVCLFCGGSVDGSAKKKYCSVKCKSDASYHGEKFTESPPKLTCDESEYGHQRVPLVKDGKHVKELVHRLVLKQFVSESPFENAEGCHKDGNPRNNHVCNLKWGTQSDNWDDRKRHGNRISYAKISDRDAAEIRASSLEDAEISARYGVSSTQIRNIRDGKQWQDIPTLPENCWVGCTVENQEWADKRIPELLKIPAKVRFLSVEPMLGPVDLTSIRRTDRIVYATMNPLTGFGANGKIDWVIVGGESGPKARPFDIQWARSTVAQCRDASVACFVKQMGSNPIEFQNIVHKAAGTKSIRHQFSDSKGGKIEEFEQAVRVRQWPT